MEVDAGLGSSGSSFKVYGGLEKRGMILAECVPRLLALKRAVEAT